MCRRSSGRGSPVGWTAPCGATPRGRDDRSGRHPARGLRREVLRGALASRLGLLGASGRLAGVAMRSARRRRRRPNGTRGRPAAADRDRDGEVSESQPAGADGGTPVTPLARPDTAAQVTDPAKPRSTTPDGWAELAARLGPEGTRCCAVGPRAARGRPSTNPARAQVIAIGTSSRLFGLAVAVGVHSAGRERLPEASVCVLVIAVDGVAPWRALPSRRPGSAASPPDSGRERARR